MLALLAAPALGLARLALHATDRLRAAVALPPPGAGRIDGAFYMTTGPAAGPRLDPPDYPEARGALTARIDEEVKDLGGDGWTRTGVVRTLRIDRLEIGGVPVALSDLSRVLIEPERHSRLRGGGRRLAIAAVMPGEQPLVAFGVFRDGALADGPSDRLVVTTLARAPEVLDMLEKAGRIKALALALAAAILLLLAGLSGRAALQRGAI
jgi:hypothetical protein